HAERRVAILSLGLDGGEPLSSKEIVSLIAQQNDGLKVSVNVVDKKRASGQKKLKKLLADLKNSIVFTYRERNSRKDKVTLCQRIKRFYLHAGCQGCLAQPLHQRHSHLGGSARFSASWKTRSTRRVASLRPCLA